MRATLMALAVAATTLATGCSKNIGDACTLSTDCSVSGDRLCDTTEPGGYCTVFNCEPDSCPSDSICVLFADTTCSAATQSVRFRRTFCMATCDSDDDCRAGYRCLDMTTEPGRSVIDLNPSSHTVCIVPETRAPATSTDEPAICGALPPAGDSGPSDPTLDATAESVEASSADAQTSDRSSEGAGEVGSVADGAGPDGAPLDSATDVSFGSDVVNPDGAPDASLVP